MTTPTDLPELPEPDAWMRPDGPPGLALMIEAINRNGTERPYFTADQMRAYALAALTAQSAEIARLTAEVERLRKDAERLDWMQRTENTPWRVTHMHGSPRTDGSGGHYWREVFDGWAANSTGDNPLPTIREAIDAAMKEKTNG